MVVACQHAAERRSPAVHHRRHRAAVILLGICECHSLLSVKSRVAHPAPSPPARSRISTCMLLSETQLFWVSRRTYIYLELLGALARPISTHEPVFE